MLKTIHGNLLVESIYWKHFRVARALLLKQFIRKWGMYWNIFCAARALFLKQFIRKWGIYCQFWSRAILITVKITWFRGFWGQNHVILTVIRIWEILPVVPCTAARYHWQDLPRGDPARRVFQGFFGALHRRKAPLAGLWIVLNALFEMLLC